MFNNSKPPGKPGESLDIPAPQATSPMPAAAPAEAPRKAARAAAIISPDVTIEGAIYGEGELQIDGRIKGDVRVQRLTIGDTGHVEGSIQAETVEVRGRVIGAISAKQVRLYGNSHVDGDITHEQLAMESGAFFQGRSLKFQRQAQPAPAPQPALAAPPKEPAPQPKAPAAV